MTYLAQDPKSGTAIRASELGDSFSVQDQLECPYCGGTLKYRRAARDESGEKLRDAHFWHTDNVGGGEARGGCSKGGESEEHEAWKELLGEFLMKEYNVDEFYVEYAIGNRYADVAIKTPGEDYAGIAVEYQSKNKDKDYLSVTKDFLKFGYAVHWVFNTWTTYDLLFDCKQALEPYIDSLYLSSAELTFDDFSFGTLIWFDNFDWVVTEPQDFEVYSGTEDTPRISGSYTSGSRERAVYDLDDTAPISTWADVGELFYSDKSGGGVLDHFLPEIRNGQFRLLGPVTDNATYDYSDEVKLA